MFKQSISSIRSLSSKLASTVYFSSSNLKFKSNICTSIVSNSYKPSICIVGSGPAALYTAQYVLKSLTNLEKTIDIYEKLPVPFGLVRYGVAPDHQDVKNVINSFTETLRNNNVNFFGNISIGTDLTINELSKVYDCVVLAYGSHSEKYLNIPGEKDFENFISAKDFVSWYNGLPGSENFKINLTGQKAVIIGAGNVALDIARILLSPIEKLEKTDISSDAIEIIKRTNKIKEVTIVARRGVLNAAFTIKELREITKIKTIQCNINIDEFKDIDIDQTLTKISRPRKRLTEFMYKISQQEQNKSADKILNIEFLKTPIEIMGQVPNSNVTAVKFKKNKYDINFIKSANLNNEDELNAIPVNAIKNESYVITPADLVIRSIGFKNMNIDTDIPFDKKQGIIPNENGKVIGKEGLYCTGWIKRGPRGVIVDTTTDANETAKQLCSDIQDLCKIKSSIQFQGGHNEIIQLLNKRGIQFVDKNGWEKIDQEEIRRGKAVGKPREKIQKVEEMLQVALRK